MNLMTCVMISRRLCITKNLLLSALTRDDKKQDSIFPTMYMSILIEYIALVLKCFFQVLKCYPI